MNFRRRQFRIEDRLFCFADNVTLNTGTGGDVIATEDIGSVEYQKIKITDGTATSTTMLKVAAEDAAHSSGDTGIISMAVRSDTLAALGGDNDYTPLQVDADGAVWNREKLSIVDSGNSTATPINANIDYTGTWVDCLQYAGITVTATADQNSDANGVRMEFSSDGSNVDLNVGGGFDFVANTQRQWQFPVQARYFRVVWQNGGTNQTVFRLQTVLHRKSVAITSVHRADADIAVDRSATLVKSILMAQAAGSGNFTPVDATATGNLKVSIEEIDATNLPTNTVQLGGTAISMNTGTRDAGTQRVTIATDDVVPASQSGTWNITNVSGTVSLPTGAATETTLATIAGDTTSLDGKDLMLGTDFSSVLGTADLTTTGTIADAVAATQDVLNVRNFNYVYNGTTFDLMREGGEAGSVLVDLGANNDVTVSGTVTVDLGANNDVTVTGGNAHDGTTLGNPVLGGARATNSVEGVTQVANADLTHVQADLNGCIVTRNATTLEEIVSERVSNTNGTSTDCTGAFAAGGANIHAYITSVTVHNSHASTNGYVDLRDGAAGGIVWTLPAPAGGGTTHNFNPPLKFAANTAVAYDVSAAITTVYISLNGFFAQG